MLYYELKENLQSPASREEPLFFAFDSELSTFLKSKFNESWHTTSLLASKMYEKYSYFYVLWTMKYRVFLVMHSFS